MSFESDLYTRLSNDTGLTALVDTRIYPLVAPANTTRPYCCYMVVSQPHQYSHSGFSGLSQVRTQVSCYADNHGSAKSVADAVIAALESWSDNNTIQCSMLLNEQDVFEKETGLYHVPVEFSVAYKQN